MTADVGFDRETGQQRTEPEPVTRPVPVLYIAGKGRSGSTLIGRVLGNLPGTVSVGEIVFVWSRGLLQNELCGCGLPFLSCPFWQQVGERGFGGWGAVDAAEAVRLQRAVDRNRYIPFMLQPRLSPSYAQRMERYAELLGRLYRGVRAAAGGALVVDASKHPSYAFLLRQVPDIDLRVVHLIRQSHGVCYSWTRQVQKPEVTGDVVYMHRYTPARTAIEWTTFNAALDLLPKLGVPTQRLNYEDFIRSPRASVRRLLALAEHEVPPEGLDFIGTDSVQLPDSHTLSGNPMRFRTGPLRLRIDDEWRTSMSRSTQSLVTACTLPGLVRYGYLRRQAPRDVSGAPVD